MKKILVISSFVLAFITITSICTAATKAVPAKQEKIQVAILLDTSGSMSGLIEQAKSRLWNIVNTLTTLKYNGQEPSIEISLYEYGSHNKYDGDFIRQIVPLTKDLDRISEELFALNTGGSLEYCGTVIQRAVRELDWGKNQADMKLIYIAGNEIFEQGKVPYKKAIDEAVKNNIYVNTIHCGNRDQGIRDYWQNAAMQGKGKFFNIDHNAAVRYIVTPFDDAISTCNSRLNDTYIGYGIRGDVSKANQTKQDANALSLSSAIYAERAISKSKSAYTNSSWDLVDMVKEDPNALDKIKKEELPEELRNKNKEEIKKVVTQKQKERDNIQKEISKLAKQRQDYIDQQVQTEKTGDDLGNAITQSILNFAEAKGYKVEK